MTPEEIVADINGKNCDILYAYKDCSNLSREQVLSLMNAAAMQGFRMGSNVALSMVKGSLVVQLSRGTGVRADNPGA